MSDNVLEPKDEIAIYVDATITFRLELPKGIKDFRVDRAAGGHEVIGHITAWGKSEEEARAALVEFKAALGALLS